MINTFFCHELFANVFVMLDYVDLLRAAQVCTLWRNHIKAMQGTLFRHFYIHLGGDPATREGLVDSWKEEVKTIVQCETDLTVYNYACKIGDEVLKESIINDGGFCMDLCNHIVQKGGCVSPSVLVLDFKKRLAAQSAKFEFYDIVNALCVMAQDSEGDNQFYLRACVDNGSLIKRIRKLFLESKQQVDSLRIALFTDAFLLARKLPADNQTKLEVWNIVKILASPLDQEMWELKKLASSKRLGLGRVKNLIFEVE